MFNLKEGGGSFKGIIGECMFKLTNKNVVITKFFNREKYFNVFGKYFNPQQVDFLANNWYSIDAIEIIYTKTPREVYLYEIKTRNKYISDLPFKPKMTLETHQLYNHAKTLGFVAKIVTVWLYNNWDYEVELKDFNEKDYCIDKPKLYDKVRGK